MAPPPLVTPIAPAPLTTAPLAHPPTPLAPPPPTARPCSSAPMLPAGLHRPGIPPYAVHPSLANFGGLLAAASPALASQIPQLLVDGRGEIPGDAATLSMLCAQLSSHFARVAAAGSSPADATAAAPPAAPPAPFQFPIAPAPAAEAKGPPAPTALTPQHYSVPFATLPTVSPTLHTSALGLPRSSLPSSSAAPSAAGVGLTRSAPPMAMAPAMAPPAPTTDRGLHAPLPSTGLTGALPAMPPETVAASFKMTPTAVHDAVAAAAAGGMLPYVSAAAPAARDRCTDAFAELPPSKHAKHAFGQEEGVKAVWKWAHVEEACGLQADGALKMEETDVLALHMSDVDVLQYLNHDDTA